MREEAILQQQLTKDTMPNSTEVIFSLCIICFFLYSQETTMSNSVKFEQMDEDSDRRTGMTRKLSDDVFIKNPEFEGTRSIKTMFMVRSSVQDGQHSLHCHFLPEGLRFVAYTALGIVMLGGAILYELSKTSLTPMKDTYIYKTFGFPHSCVLIDEGPPKTYATLMLPLWEYPMVFYLLTSAQRTYDDWRENRVSKEVMMFALIVTPFNVLSTILFRHVFVWGPGANGETFGAHYGFYIWYQLTLALDITRNVLYLDCLKQLPFKNNRALSYSYLAMLILLTIIYMVFGISAAAGSPVFNWTSYSSARDFLQGVTIVYFLFEVPVPIFLSLYGVVYGKQRYITIATS
jgi:hypothetical protein